MRDLEWPCTKLHKQVSTIKNVQTGQIALGAPTSCVLFCLWVRTMNSMHVCRDRTLSFVPPHTYAFVRLINKVKCTFVMLLLFQMVFPPILRDPHNTDVCQPLFSLPLFSLPKNTNTIFLFYFTNLSNFYTNKIKMMIIFFQFIYPIKNWLLGKTINEKLFKIIFNTNLKIMNPWK